MEKDFDYNQVPKTYLHCLNAQCLHAHECLRYQVALRADKKRAILDVINPAHVAGREEKCPYLQYDRLDRFALGITHLFDQVPHAKAVKVRGILFDYFGRNMYYRLLHKERLIKPEEQAYICQVFRNAGVNEKPAFDEYVEAYSWESGN